MALLFGGGPLLYVVNFAKYYSNVMKNNIDESLEIVSHDSRWPRFYLEEARQIKKVFEKGRLISIEHYGSTSVPGLNAKSRKRKRFWSF